MKPTACIFNPLAFLLIFSTVFGSFQSLAGPPVVSNVRASQRAGTGLVDIYYDANDPDGDTVAITLQVSFDAGNTYRDAIRSLSGPGYGRSVSGGRNLHIIWDAGADLDPILFRNVRVKVTADDGFANTPAQMVYIPAGGFQMGDPSTQGGSDERPAHTVYVSGFYMDKYEVTIALWNEVFGWAVAHGYNFDGGTPTDGRSNHPAQEMNWFDAVKWANARSEMRGRTPAYYTDTGLQQIYRTGQVNLSNANVKWDANGYRLPTEAEWEKAARGGLAGHHFPWPSLGGPFGNYIDGSKANYANSGDPFGNTSPPTTPVGYYNGSQTPAGVDMANGYGLYDMAGNVWEWVWDWHSGSWYGTADASRNDPRGPASGFVPCVAGRRLERRPDLLPGGHPGLRHAGRPGLVHRFPPCPRSTVTASSKRSCPELARRSEGRAQPACAGAAGHE